MNPTNITLPNHYFLQMIQLVQDQGVPTQSWLRQLGLTVPTNEDTQITLPWETFRALITDADRFCPEGALGLLLGERLLITAHGVVGYAALSSRNLREMLQVIERYMVLRVDMVTMETKESAGFMQVTFYETRPLENIKPIVMEAVMLAVRNILDFTTLGHSHLHHVHLPFSGDKKLAEALFHCPVEFNQTSASFFIPLTAIDKPLQMANSVSFQQTLAVCQEELDKLSAEQSLSARIRKSLLQCRNGFPTLETTARRLNLTPRTLHRKLIAEGTSYRELLEGIRELLATRYLEIGQMTVKEVAFSLGYSDAANFRKAFKRWKNIAPSEFQAEALQVKARKGES